jgi:hypothetical protein
MYFRERLLPYADRVRSPDISEAIHFSEALSREKRLAIFVPFLDRTLQ